MMLFVINGKGAALSLNHGLLLADSVTTINTIKVLPAGEIVGKDQPLH
jgi:hypothetical protein